MAVALGLNQLKKKRFRTLSLLCDDEPLSDAQLKAYQTRLQEYQTFLDSVVRLALCGNVCVTEEAVTIGEHGLLTGESLNALQHAGAISVYNTLQQNNWEFPIAEEGEVAVVKTHNPIPDEFLDSEKPIRSDWPAIHISECFIDGERAKIHGSVRPLRTFLPPTVVFRNAADIDEDIPEPELNVPNASNADGAVELVPSAKGITVKRVKKDTKEVEYIPIEEYYFGRQEGTKGYYEEKGDFRFKCAVCQRIFYSNVKLMSHILGHVDEVSQAGLDVADATHCQQCDILFPSAFEYRAHMDQEHSVTYSESEHASATAESNQVVAQSASQLLLQQRDGATTHEDAIMEQSQHTIGSVVLNCRICGKETNSELALAHHLQSSHRQREMPYVCRLCLFRSSLFEDILDHFKKLHDNSNHLLCTYCLRIFTPSDARSPHYASPTGSVNLGPGVGQTQVYLQHLRMHQIRNQLRRCPTCKLNFTNKSDYQVHRRLDHKAVRDENSGRPDESGLDTYEATDQTVRHLKETQPHITLMNAPEAGGVMDLALLRLPSDICQMSCLECGETMDSDAHKRYLPCSLCRFATCCSAGYNRHVSRVHVYVAGSQPVEPDSGMPMVRPIYFQWIGDEVTPLELLNVPEQVTTTSDQPQTHSEPQELSETIEQEHMEQQQQQQQDEQQPAIDKELQQQQQEQQPEQLSLVDSQIDELLEGSEQSQLETQPKSVENSEQKAELTDTLAEETTEKVVPSEEPTTGTDPGAETMNAQEALVENLMVETASSEPTTETKAQMDAVNMDQATENIEIEKDTDPVVFQENSVPTESNVTNLTIANEAGEIEGEQPAGHLIVEEARRIEMIMRYMSSLLDAGLFACTHCAASAMNGNTLARHMVEECGTSTATLNPDPLLVKARQEAEEQYRLQQAQELEQAETAILFESSDVNMPGGELSGVVQHHHQSERVMDRTGEEDVVMMSVDSDALTTYGFMESEDQSAVGTHLVTQVGPNGTTIDVTNAGGEVVQQFLLPDDLQLEEGQTLVMIQGEDGQPQLAIVNQADLIDQNNQQLMMQAEDNQTSNMLLYSTGMEGQHHLEDAALVGQEEEKENHQYTLG